MKRRTFLGHSAALPFLLHWPTREKLNILVLGGTVFLGPAIVNACKAAGHRITLFNRGITNPALFPDLPLLKGDRENGQNAYQSLLKENWDIVIDVWPQKSQLVDEATEALQGNAGHYVFISSIAVYNSYRTIGLNETSEVITPREDRNVWDYGEEKVTSEDIVRTRFKNNHTILRPGAIKGWRDPATDLLYWLVRLKEGKDILGPGRGTDPFQFIDVKDVGSLAVDLSSRGVTGTFNCTGPTPGKINWKEFLECAKRHLHSTSQIIYPDPGFLRENKVRAFDDLPLWVPVEEDPGFMQISSQKARSKGMKFTPIEQTIDDCLNWHAVSGQSVEVGLDIVRETKLLESWKSLNEG